MAEKKDTRWVQRFEKYNKAFKLLDELMKEKPQQKQSKAEKLGFIKSFELVYELAWQTLKDFLECEYADRLKNEAKNGNTISGSGDAFRYAKKYKLLARSDALVAAIKDRNLTVHTYNEDTANDILDHILNRYYDAFKELHEVLLEQKTKRGL